MKTLKLRASSEALRWRRTAFAITGIEIGLLILKNETGFMSNSMRIVSGSGSARVLPDAHFEVDFFPAAERRSGRRGVSRPGFALDGEDNGLERDKETGQHGQKTSGF